MHCLASSLCFWLWTIFRETAEYIQNYPGGDYEDSTESNVVETLLRKNNGSNFFAGFLFV